MLLDLHLQEIKVTLFKTMNSLLNETKLNFKKGQQIKYFDYIGKIQIAKYLMAGDKEDEIVVVHNGNTVTVKINKLWPPIQ